MRRVGKLIGSPLKSRKRKKKKFYYIPAIEYFLISTPQIIKDKIFKKETIHTMHRLTIAPQLTVIVVTFDTFGAFIQPVVIEFFLSELVPEARLQSTAEGSELQLCVHWRRPCFTRAGRH